MFRPQIVQSLLQLLAGVSEKESTPFVQILASRLPAPVALGIQFLPSFQGVLIQAHGLPDMPERRFTSRWSHLRQVGLAGFKQPVQEVGTLTLQKGAVLGS